MKLKYGGVDELRRQKKKVGEIAVLVGQDDRLILYIISKAKYFHKPRYPHEETFIQNFRKSIVALRNICDDLQIEKLAIPKLGCGKDLLYWSVVKQIIIEAFKGSQTEVTVYELSQEERDAIKHTQWQTVQRRTNTSFSTPRQTPKFKGNYTTSTPITPSNTGSYTPAEQFPPLQSTSKSPVPIPTTKTPDIITLSTPPSSMAKNKGRKHIKKSKPNTQTQQEVNYISSISVHTEPSSGNNVSPMCNNSENETTTSANDSSKNSNENIHMENVPSNSKDNQQSPNKIQFNTVAHSEATIISEVQKCKQSHQTNYTSKTNELVNNNEQISVSNLTLDKTGIPNILNTTNVNSTISSNDETITTSDGETDEDTISGKTISSDSISGSDQREVRVISNNLKYCHSQLTKLNLETSGVDFQNEIF